MSSGAFRPTRAVVRWWRPALALVAAGLAAIPLVISRLVGETDLDPFFLILVAASLLVAGLLWRAPDHPGTRYATRAIAVAWVGAAAWAAALLVNFQMACACSRIDPASLPPRPPLAQLATFFHVLATYGGGALVAIAAFAAPARPAPAPATPAPAAPRAPGDIA